MANRFELTERGARRLQRLWHQDGKLPGREVMELTVLDEVSNEGSVEAFFDGSIKLEPEARVDLHRSLRGLVRAGYIERVEVRTD